MSRRTFFSFHYTPDVQRAMVVRNSWVTKENREDAGFFDSSVFEASQRTGDDALRRFLHDGLKNSTVTCVLAGTETAGRRWVRYELVQSFRRGNGLLCVHIHRIKNFDKQSATAGTNPLDVLAYKVEGERILFFENNADKWKAYKDAPSMALSDAPYAVADGDYKCFSALFGTYEWFGDNGADNLGMWIEAAATAAGR